MRCPEFRDVMRSFLDGEVDGDTRREVGRHIVDCPDCAQLIEQDGFWDDAVRRHLDHDLPAGLRQSILGTEAAVDGAAGGRSHTGWREFLRISWWAIRRDLKQPRLMLRTVAGSLLLMLAVLYGPRLLFRDEPEPAPFTQAGPIVHVDEDGVPHTGDEVSTARLILPGRLI